MNIRTLLAGAGTSADLKLDGAEARLTVGPGNYLVLDAADASWLAGALEEAARAMRDPDEKAAAA